jgi:biopolymer transport protein ExbD
MAMATGGQKSLENDINVTPMIDVLLVLLIIFMAALPSMRKAIDIQLPDPTPSVAPANATSNQIVLEVLPGGQYSINTEKVGKDRLGSRLKEIYEHQHREGRQGSPRLTAEGDLRAAPREDHLCEG